MIQLREQFWAVEVPERYAQITVDPVGPILMWWSYEGAETGINLPPGTWEIVCISKNIISGNELGIIDADEFITLLTSKGCDLNKNWLILKKQ